MPTNNIKPSSTPIPAAVQAKMNAGQPQRHAMATTPSVQPSKTGGLKK